MRWGNPVMRNIGVVHLVGIVPLFLGCSANVATTEPGRTSYPRQQVTRTPVKMWIAPGLSVNYRIAIPGGRGRSNAYEASGARKDFVTYDFVKTEIGDTAEAKVFIVPTRRLPATERALFRIVPRRGNELCGGRYRISESKYYYGNEATLRMLGIATPALFVTFRCPVYHGHAKSASEREIRRLTARQADFVFFDTLSKEFNVPQSRLAQAVRRTAHQRRLPIVEEKRIPRGEYILAGKGADRLRWGRLEKLAATVKGRGGKSSLTFILASYQLTYHKRGVFRRGRSEYRGPAPWDRKTSYRRAKQLLGSVEKILNTQ